MKKKIKSFISYFIFILLIVVCGKFLRYILIDDTTSYTRVTFHEMYEQDNIDVLFVGSSHCYRSFIPEIFDERLGVNTFNAGTSAQNMDGSFMVIQEAARYNDIKHIYLELYYDCAFGRYKDRTEMTQTYLISDYIRPSFDKVQYLLNASTNDYYFNSFILARRNWSKLFDINYMKNLIMKKQTDTYKNYEYTYITGETEWYAGKGYVSNNEVVEDWNYFSENGWNNMNFNNVSLDWLNTLENIIKFCSKKKISLTFVSAPISNFLLTAIENYDDYVKLVTDIVADTDINYYDFNLCREKYFPNTSTLFKDVDHVNCYGAEIFSNLFADLITGRISEEDLFYDSYEEKIKNMKPMVFGISYHDCSDDNGKSIRRCKIVSNYSDDLLYKIVLTSDEGNQCVVQEFSDNSFFSVASDSHGICTITYRLKDFPNNIENIDITY